MRRFKIALIGLVAFALQVFRPTILLAWGPEGHEVVAQIAHDRLSVNAKREVRKLLGSKSLADVATNIASPDERPDEEPEEVLDDEPTPPGLS